MKHLALPRFWQLYRSLPASVQELADKNYALLRNDPFHPSLHLKKVGRTKQLWSVRIGSITVLWGWNSRRALYGSGSARMLSTTSCWRSLTV